MADEPQRAPGLQHNPFWLLGATPHDDAHRIVALAEEKALQLDDEVCRRARADLTSPKFRLAAELGWFPGLDPARIADLLARLAEPRFEQADEPTLPPLARVNLMAAIFQAVAQGGAAHAPAPQAVDEAAGRILRFAHLLDAIDAGAVLHDINQDRARSGFAAVRGADQVAAELVELRRRHRATLREVLDAMPAATLVAVMAEAVRVDTERGTRQATRFLDELVDLYQEETTGFLERELAKVAALIERIRALVVQDPAAVPRRLDALERVLRNWVKVAEPAQLSAKARGLQHEASRAAAWQVRGLAVDLFNKHNRLDDAKRLTDLLRELFADVPDVAAKMDGDAEAIRAIGEDRKTAGAKEAEWAKQITFRTQVGRLARRDLAISPDGVEWQGKRIPLAAITRVRWGGVRHSVNGIPTGTTLTVGVGDDRTEAVITLRDQTKYQAFLDKLWPAVCQRLMIDILEALRAGRTLTFGDAVVSDLGVTLTRRKLFRANETAFADWFQIRIWSANGQFYIGAQSDKKLYATMSYIQTPNAHLLEHLIRLKFKNTNRTLSALLNPQPAAAAPAAPS
jgi:hypothetical protein